MNDDLEQRLRDYGATIDAATVADLTERDHASADVSPHPAALRPRRTATALALLAIVGVAVVGVLLLGHRGTHIRVATSPVITTTTSTSTSPCDPNGGDSAACPEQGPPLTPQQRAQFAQWRSEYNPADVTRVTKAQLRIGPIDDVALVETMEGDIGCAVTRSAWAAAKQAAPERRAAVVDDIMQGELARLRERNWPPQSQMPNIFQRLAEQLKTGDLTTFDAPRSLFEGECGHALRVQP